MELTELQERWIDLFWTMENDPAIQSERLAGPFLSVAPDNYDPVGSPTILYVGKATRDGWYADEFRRNPVRSERLSVTRRFLRDWIESQAFRSAFWRFAWRLNELTAKRRELFETVVWSNVAKIGVHGGNPEGRYLTLQSDLARKTLEAEIKYYRPSLIVFVSGDYAEGIVRPVLSTIGASQDDADRWNTVRDDLWWRTGDSALPPIMCANHPERKASADLQAWLDCADMLLRG